MKKISDNEKSVLVAIVENAKSVGDTGVEFFLEDVAKQTSKSIHSISATAGSLADKGLLICYNGESYFDGEVTEAGLHEVEEINKVKQEVEQTKTNDMAEKTKKEVDNFDAPVMDERIVKLNELKSVKMSKLSKSKRPAAKEAKELANYILANWDNLAELKNIKSEDVKNVDLQNILSSRLQNFADASKAAEKAVKELEKSNEADSKEKNENKKKDKQPKEKAAKVARKVGEIHPNHPTWVWTEYVPGKFDWRTNPADKRQGQRTDKMKNGSKSEKKSSKKPVEKKEDKKQMSLEEWILYPKITKQKNSMSNAQREAFKLINKGYRITPDKKFFQNEEGDNKACNWSSVEAMFRRYGIDYIPQGLIKEE